MHRSDAIYAFFIRHRCDNFKSQSRARCSGQPASQPASQISEEMAANTCSQLDAWPQSHAWTNSSRRQYMRVEPSESIQRRCTACDEVGPETRWKLWRVIKMFDGVLPHPHSTIFARHTHTHVSTDSIRYKNRYSVNLDISSWFLYFSLAFVSRSNFICSIHSVVFFFASSTTIGVFVLFFFSALPFSRLCWIFFSCRCHRHCHHLFAFCVCVLNLID